MEKFQSSHIIKKNGNLLKKGWAIIVKTLKNQVAIVTGAGSHRGVGKACALKLAEAGANVVITARIRNASDPNKDVLETAIKEAQALGVKALAMAVDVTNRDQVRTCIERTLEEFGRIDILVNNAGTPAGAAPFLEVTPEEWQHSWQTNVMGTVNFCQLVIPLMQQSGGGAIVNIVSLLGLGALPKYGAYVTTKHAAVGLTKTMAAEFAKVNIRVNAICPGIIDTKMNDHQVEATAKRRGISIKEAQEELAGKAPMGRFGTAEEIADAAVYLASPAASYVTGVTLEVAGGLGKGL